MLQILKDLFSDAELADYLAFKGGTALMFFYDLPRFSVDLDFNLLDTDKEKVVHDKVRKILLKYGELTDGETKKFAKTKLRKETISLLGFFKAFPTLA